MSGPVRTYYWPSLMVDEWTATRDTLHMWTQIVGKIRMVHMPLLNHWWQVTLYMNSRGVYHRRSSMPRCRVRHGIRLRQPCACDPA
jgi:Family of unknown function (DUF5996)